MIEKYFKRIILFPALSLAMFSCSKDDGTSTPTPLVLKDGYFSIPIQ